MKLDMKHVLFFSSLGDCNKGSKQQKVGMVPTSDRKNPARKRLLLVVVICILCPSRPWTHSNVHLWWCNGFGICGLCLSWKDIHPGSRKLQRMEESARLEELESRFRTVPRCTMRWKIVCLCQALKKNGIHWNPVFWRWNRNRASNLLSSSVPGHESASKRLRMRALWRRTSLRPKFYPGDRNLIDLDMTISFLHASSLSFGWSGTTDVGAFPLKFGELEWRSNLLHRTFSKQRLILASLCKCRVSLWQIVPLAYYIRWCILSVVTFVLQVGELVLDPIERHVKRRLVRQREKIHGGLEVGQEFRGIAGNDSKQDVVKRWKLKGTFKILAFWSDAVE